MIGPTTVLVAGCQPQESSDSIQEKKTAAEQTSSASKQSTEETAVATENSGGGNGSSESKVLSGSSKSEQDSVQTANIKTEKIPGKTGIKRRPTKPTDASSLADRPEKPKFESTETRNNPAEVLDLTFDDLTFEMGEDEDFAWSMITPAIHRYDGAKVKLRGFIKPSFQKNNIKQFVFVRDNQECCFGPGAALYDCVLVKMASGAETDYTVRPVTIEGTLYLRKYTGPDGNVWAIYRMKEGRVK